MKRIVSLALALLMLLGMSSACLAETVKLESGIEINLEGMPIVNEPIEFTITAEHEVEADDPKLTALTGGDMFTGEVNAENMLTGALIANVVNQSGTTLPETGGIGTTIFYVAGGLLVAGAVILLVTKRRMKMHG